MKRVKVKPGKTRSAFGFAVGIVFVMIGIFVAIPNFGLFGIFWTMVAAGIAAMNATNAFGKGAATHEIIIEDDEAPFPAADDTAARLEKLRGLYDRRLITAEEYEQRRAEILDEI